jgi:PAS domain S-box-containing protein
LYAFPEDRKKVVEILKHSGFVRDLELAGRKKGGTLIRVSLSIHVMVLKGKKHILGVIRDITAQKQTEKALLEASKQYQEIVEGAIEGIYRTTLDGRTVSANRAFASMLGYESAREVLDTVTDWGTQVWVDSSERRSFLERLSASKAIQGYECQFKRKRGEVIWVSINSRMVYDESGHALYAEGFIQEITNRKQAEAERQRFEEQLKQTLESTTSALSMAIEMRDPYTAGHQRRVADLACRMWNRLGYSSESCEGLRIAALLHDLGKLRIPTDILTKPTVLSKAELALINEHALAGWDILRFVEFPWPVATIVRQHHERLDGSGYPDGLRGSEILKESSVLAVADVVEAMASHRPYRSTLGLDAALVEISNGSGSLYSPEAVQACIALFREDGYWLPD